MNKDFGRLSSRTAQLRDEILAIRPEVCVERAILTTKAYQEHEQDQVVLKRAYMLREILTSMTIYIEDNTLIVGNQASKNRAAPIFPEYAMDWVIRELDDFEKRDGDAFIFQKPTNKFCAVSIPIGRAAPYRIRVMPAFQSRQEKYTTTALYETKETSPLGMPTLLLTMPAY